MSKAIRAVKSAQKAATVVHHGTLRTHIRAGQASASPPLGTQLGQRSVNIPIFVKDFNERTKNYKPGVPLECSVVVSADRSYQLTINGPPIPYLLMQAAGINRGAMRPRHEVAGKVTRKHVYEIANLKAQDYKFSDKSVEEMAEMVIEFARLIGIEIVDKLDPEEYAKFLEERKSVIEQQKMEIEEKRQAKMLRL